jgi:hypothetical protein
MILCRFVSLALGRHAVSGGYVVESACIHRCERAVNALASLQTVEWTMLLALKCERNGEKLKPIPRPRKGRPSARRQTVPTRHGVSVKLIRRVDMRALGRLVWQVFETWDTISSKGWASCCS